MPNGNTVISLRQSTSGAKVYGNTARDVLAYNPTTENWDATDIDTLVPANGGLYDYVVHSRADLVAIVEPVDGVFTLPSGTWFWAGTPDEVGIVALEDGESLVVPGDASFTIPAPCRILGNAPTLLRHTASLTLMGGGIIENAGDQAKITVMIDGGTLTCIGADIRLGAAAVTSTAALLIGGNCYLEAGTQVLASVANAIVMNSGELWSEGTLANAYGDATSTLEVNGGIARVNGGTLSSPEADAGARGIVVDDAAAELYMTGVNYEGIAQALTIVASAVVSVVGGVWDGQSTSNAKIALQFNGDSGAFSCVGTVFRRWAKVSDYEAGTQVSALFSGTVFEACSAGIDWPAANIPTRGLLEVGMQTNLSQASSFVGHSATDARVNRKACAGSAGLYIETAIVT